MTKLIPMHEQEGCLRRVLESWSDRGGMESIRPRIPPEIARPAAEQKGRGYRSLRKEWLGTKTKVVSAVKCRNEPNFATACTFDQD